MNYCAAFLIYTLLINLTAAAFAAADKYKAVRGKFRISEDFLLLLGFIGGAAGEYIAMKTIRHKTRRKKFMIGLPAMIFLHIAAIILVLYIIKL